MSEAEWLWINLRRLLSVVLVTVTSSYELPFGHYSHSALSQSVRPKLEEAQDITGFSGPASAHPARPRGENPLNDPPEVVQSAQSSWLWRSDMGTRPT
jgi:hypothetical protein